MNFKSALFILSLALFAGCSREELPPPSNVPEAPKAPVAPIKQTGPTNAQEKLPTIKLFISDKVMTTEMALTGLQMQTGMMYRTNMDENAGMLFVFPYPHQASFWMKNTLIPLSAAYIDQEGIIQEIHDLQAQNTNAVVAAKANIQYVLETPLGWFRSNNVSTGALIRTESGSLKESFTFHN